MICAIESAWSLSGAAFLLGPNISAQARRDEAQESTNIL